jgi:outer membrane lipoprotein-sorting protein
MNRTKRISSVVPYALALPRLQKLLPLALFFGIGVLAVTSARAQAPGLSAEQVVANNVSARGGLNAWRAIHTLAFNGSMEAGRTRPPLRGTIDSPPVSIPRVRPGEKWKSPTPAAVEGNSIALPFRLELKRSRKNRLELDFQGQTAIQVYDGREGWKVRPFLGRTTAEPYSAAELQAAADQQDLDGLLIDAAAKGNRVSNDGMEAVDGHRAYRLKVTLKDGTVRRVWVDANTWLELKMDGNRQSAGRPQAMYTSFRDYRRVNGVMIPFVMETAAEGVKSSQKIVIDRVTVNPELSDARFAKPAPSGAS